MDNEVQVEFVSKRCERCGKKTEHKIEYGWKDRKKGKPKVTFTCQVCKKTQIIYP